MRCCGVATSQKRVPHKYGLSDREQFQKTRRVYIRCDRFVGSNHLVNWLALGGLSVGNEYRFGLEGGQLAKIRLPLPTQDEDVHWPTNLGAVFAGMQQKYQSYIEAHEPRDDVPNMMPALTVQGVGAGY